MKSVTQNIRLIEKLLRAAQRVPGSRMRPSESGLRTTGIHELDRQSHWSRRGCRSRKLHCQHLLNSLQHALDRFATACDRAGMKFSTRSTEVLCLSTNPRQCVRQVNGNTLQQVDKFNYLGVLFTSDGRRSVMRLMHGLVKLTQFCVSFVDLWPQNGSFQSPQSCQFSNRFLFRSLPMVMNLG